MTALLLARLALQLDAAQRRNRPDLVEVLP